MQTQMIQTNEAIANSTLVSSSASMWEIDQGCTAKVIGFVGISAAYLRRMREIGLDIGAEIICLNRPPFSAPRQFQICDGVFSLDKDIAASIQVSAV
jgi:Fe2+ transport system protein FeoA